MIALTGGGTGGHLEVVRLLQAAFYRRGIATIFIGSAHGQDRGWFEGDRGFADTYFLPTRGVVDRGPLKSLLSLAMIARASLTAAAILKRHGIGAVVNVGSYVAAPASFAAVLCRIPLFVHEASAKPSPLTLMLRRHTAGYFNSYGAPSPVTDFPVDQAFFDAARTRRQVKRVIFLGGSQGAMFINDFALACAPALTQSGIAITHQTGWRDFERVRAGYRAIGVEADVFAFDRAIVARMAAADLAVSRAGGGTLWELVANGLPTLFVPFPHAARDHQYHNARFLADRGLGFVTRQSALNLERLRAVIAADLHAISTGLMRLVRPGGAGRIADYIMNWISGQGR